MIKFLLSFISLLMLFSLGVASRNEFKTNKYSGSYAYGDDIEKGRIGYLIIYPETHDSILFHMDLNRGAPSYNMGGLYGRVKIINGTGIFQKKNDYSEKSCKWKITFNNKETIIKTIDDQDACGFGYGVYVDGKFKKISNKIEKYFKTQEGRKIYFSKTKPEDYYKE